MPQVNQVALRQDVIDLAQRIRYEVGTVNVSPDENNALEQRDNGLYAEQYVLPTAGTNVKGGVKVGNGLSMNGDTLNCTVTNSMILDTVPSTTEGAMWYVYDPADDNDDTSDLPAVNAVLGTEPLTLEGAMWLEDDILKIRHNGKKYKVNLILDE